MNLGTLIRFLADALRPMGELSIGDRIHPPPTWVPATSGAEDQQSRVDLLHQGIGFNGRQYTFAGYRYDRLEDAKRQAMMVSVDAQKRGGSDSTDSKVPFVGQVL